MDGHLRESGVNMQKVTTCLWFNRNAEEAVNFYLSIFKNSKILDIARYPEGAPYPKGSVMLITFQLAGQEYLALNGGPEFKHTPAMSLSVDCESQAEVDRLWDKLTSGGQESQCGWLTDKYGVSWQLVPKDLLDMMQDKDPEKSKRVTQALMKMKKIDIDTLQRARDGKAA
jgi:predicted 3-demethylubiquinone-9 3-methyltransferase (glyoxalase superfamily)